MSELSDDLIKKIHDTHSKCASIEGYISGQQPVLSSISAAVGDLFSKMDKMVDEHSRVKVIAAKNQQGIENLTKRVDEVHECQKVLECRVGKFESKPNPEGKKNSSAFTITKAKTIAVSIIATVAALVWGIISVMNYIKTGELPKNPPIIEATK